ncbi:cytochrome b/b6 domain-containing protein [Devosia sp. XJ19-1]|uniref:Cytochrome b/b6 domain-containing protein n=1 Tax=Devosia ureilytica TaxID=2952754 RepID=A0A9Q4FSF0_9HYPH|nr:cytochrome b/b6 domain-containing protein [Devosia ureilytica]MCP8882837.1 cytochrome b/b6 domain-containing protein [Devosia ureilytica]MCP8886795.1 cytochrome b/b6 domain-containing protein [Devosia ureilytica]
MSLHSSPERYGAIAASIHWLSALAVILMLVSGRVMENARDLVASVLPVHVTLGLLVGLLTLFRVIWWLFLDKHPAPVAGMSQAQNWASRLVHMGLYGAILVMVASGVGMVALTGALPALFSGGPLPQFNTVGPYGVHGLVSWLLVALFIGHVAAALWHQFVTRDGLIGRMRLG